MCECKKIITFKVWGDYDGILYTECKDCGKKVNVHTGIEFYEGKQRNGYSPLFQFKDGNLVGYSIYKAEGLTVDDDLNDGGNLLWGTRGKKGDEELVFKPIKNLSIPHIKNILIEKHTRNKEYLKAFTDRLTSVITINKN